MLGDDFLSPRNSELGEEFLDASNNTWFHNSFTGIDLNDEEILSSNKKYKESIQDKKITQ